MEEKTKLSKDYLDHINQGYHLSKELGLPPEILNGLASGNNRMKAMQQGMELYQKEQALEKESNKKLNDRDIIPAFDLDQINDRDLPIEKNEPQKDKGKDFDIEL